MKLNVTAQEVQRFPSRYIDSIKSPDRHVLQSNRKMHDAFRAHFRDHFACCPDLPLQEFRSYLADFPCLGAVQGASCEVVVTECEVNHWFAQGAILGSITKSVITLLKKGDKHVWEGLDYYRPITLLKTELKILARVLANYLQVVISDLIGLEQTYAVKGRVIQDNLHFICEVLEGIGDGTEAALISLRPSIELTIGFWRLFWRLPD